jgi:hypothetical protein
MMEASTGNLNPFGLKKSFSFTQERNEVDDVNKASETVCALNKGNNKITELRTIFQRESQNS